MNTLVLAASLLTLVLDMPNEEMVPRKTRSTNQAPSTEGLYDLKISGSSQFSLLGFKALLTFLNNPSNLIIIDLRQESHGFINGAAVTWFAPYDWGNLGKTNEEAAQAEKALLSQILVGTHINIEKIVKKYPDGRFTTESIPFYVEAVSNEKSLINKPYKRFYFTDHLKPNAQELDRFLAFYRSLPEDRWLHFHCRAGDGRTTTFMSLVDMIYNAPKVPLDEIMERQYRLGGSNLFKTHPDDDWRKAHHEERKEFLKQFYNYVRSGSYHNNIKWSTYIDLQ